MEIEKALRRAFELIDGGMERVDLKAQKIEQDGNAVSCQNLKISAYRVGSTIRIDVT